MSVLAARVSPEWLSLREPADNDARSRDLVGRLREWLPTAPLVIHDLGSGTGSMTRWLAPRLPRPQRWVLHDVDDELLARAAATPAPRVLQEDEVTISTRRGDVTRLEASDLEGAALVTTSALLDLLTVDEVQHIVTACVASGTPALFTLSVTGRVQLAPRHPLDRAIGAAFNAHQRRTVGGRQLLGPDAVPHVSTAFAQVDAEVLVAASPWRLGAGDVDLVNEWLTGWVAAACEQQPELAEPARDYLRQRRAATAAGQLRVSVGHADLLAIPLHAWSNHTGPSTV